jgi:hypothetical protein
MSTLTVAGVAASQVSVQLAPVEVKEDWIQQMLDVDMDFRPPSQELQLFVLWVVVVVVLVLDTSICPVHREDLEEVAR